MFAAALFVSVLYWRVATQSILGFLTASTRFDSRSNPQRMWVAWVANPDARGLRRVQRVQTRKLDHDTNSATANKART